MKRGLLNSLQMFLWLSDGYSPLNQIYSLPSFITFKIYSLEQQLQDTFERQSHMSEFFGCFFFHNKQQMPLWDIN